MKSKLIISATVFVLIVSGIIFVVYHFANYNVSSKEKMQVVASNGEKFKMVYTLYNFPDESYNIELYGKSGNKTSIFHGDGIGTKDVDIIYLLNDNDVNYYKAVKKHWKGDEEKIFACSNSKKLDMMTDGSYIESYEINIILDAQQSNESLEFFSPIAKYEIETNNRADYIMIYGEKLILSGENTIDDKLKYFVEYPDEIISEVYTKDEIIMKCQELLNKYGG